MTRKFTNKLFEMIEDGLLSYETVAKACLTYMSEDEVKDLMSVNDLIEEEEEE